MSDEERLKQAREIIEKLRKLEEIRLKGKSDNKSK